MLLNDSERLEDHFEFTSIWFNIHQLVQCVLYRGHYYDSRSNLSGAVWWWLSWFELLDSLSQPFAQMSGTQ